ncbi:hypothetical protein SFBM_1045 [Candidatus Arthromitus sp. SFB-mouse-Japan]|uniref:DsbA family oxidoreductase n=1 Tax=unclassified Candidatus Neoarthromitus TaxID=2638829 RepID=UPI00021B7F67|nr:MULTISPECIES: DsbA family protein [unclassified Candidatus Arthromitus]EIA23247.1 Putative dithiol-disulfide isomerase involved in polyketide biosynthesis [Candidatus Arthromitus sp. SFB-1]EIA23271.1 Putative dithiol-disulfide isomerase involved in polyketide biosynthesis [Candidatus Arthromitus sp. SFB-2]EIA26717.1 Putative dithiol-disulfide isomerase involved in polyketide biosynthesis [Candidatus Arthromitus sp. SFB-3]EIA26912.1 Putative dithiol-disulfide isomerase involved in polyketide 
MINVKLFYDFICPFSYVCKAMFDKLEKEYPINVEYYAKELHVDISENGIETSELLGALPNYSSILKILGNIGIQYGIKINDVKIKYNTKTALILSKFAKKYNKESEYINIIYKMMFESLDNISDLDKIQQVFENLGIPTNLTDEELKKCYVEYSNDASHAIDVGLTGVPFVIINNDIKIHGLREEKIYVQKIISCLDEVNELNDLSRKRFDLNAVSAK